MALFRLSPLAESDLEQIWVYTLNEWSMDQANRYYDQIIDTIGELASGERHGRNVDIRDGYMKYPVGKHFVFFVTDKSGISVIRILHQSMDTEQHL